MTRPIYLLLLLTLIATFSTSAQDIAQSPRDLQLQQVLGMSKEQYNAYREGLEQYDKRITDVMKDSTLDKNARALALAKVLGERRTYVEQHLSEEQRKKLHEFNRQIALVSPRLQRQRELEARLVSRGIKVVKDTTMKSQ